ncbi:hypothetical protein AKJ09_00048 [Labilithrix luteola]|uniref:N-acetyltransferase domain-containing protein n=2 Tax=Labilithrix luteola TaxID=1391654 RepID=A0A0K1PJU7_9BACT|nr:hypothetical protein AKJ09_00048 [Labilithrix luteola]
MGRATDLPFVVDSWSKHSHVRGERLRDATARVRAILAAPTTVLRVVTLPDDDDAILGWSVLTSDASPKLHYVYLRRELRGQGIARVLLAGVDNPRGKP